MHGVCVPALGGGLSRHTKPQRQVTHTVHNHTLVLGSVLCDPPQPGLHHMVPVQELLLGTGLHPDLVLCVRGEEVEGCYVESELACLSELAKTCS